MPEIVTRARRHPGAHPGRPLVHQGDDGRDRRRVRRRALRALLLPRLLARRLRHARRAAHARRAGRDAGGHDAVAACSPRTTATSPAGEINSDGRRPGRGASTQVTAAFDARARGQHRRARRPHRQQRRRLVVQRAAVATPSRCCASTSRRADGATMVVAAGRGARPWSGEVPLMEPRPGCCSRSWPARASSHAPVRVDERGQRAGVHHATAAWPSRCATTSRCMLLDEATPGPAGHRRRPDGGDWA